MIEQRYHQQVSGKAVGHQEKVDVAQFLNAILTGVIKNIITSVTHGYRIFIDTAEKFGRL